MKTKIVMISIAAVIILSISLAYSNTITGSFYKAFSKTLTPGEIAEQNITVRKYYNMTIRFRYSVDGSDLSFSDDDGTVVLKNSNQEIGRVTGIRSGKIYTVKDRMDIDAINSVELLNVDKYDTVNGGEVAITFIGTKAYMTVLVVKKQGNATLQGYVIDDLTNQPLSDIAVLAYEKNSDVNTTNPVGQSVTENGRYFLNLQADSDGKSYDIYIKDYTVTS